MTTDRSGEPPDQRDGDDGSPTHESRDTPDRERNRIPRTDGGGAGDRSTDGERSRERDPDDGRARDASIPTDRESPVGAPVIRGDESVAGPHAREAVQFDPDDPDSLEEAAETVRTFASDSGGDDHLFMLRGAAACAALVRAEGSYKAAAERAGSEVTVSFIRKWARVHDLPRSVRKQVAIGEIAPTAAKHIARVSGEARLLLAWAILDGDLTVREVRSVASAVNDGTSIERALADCDVALGELELRLPPETYRDLRRRASIDDVDPGRIVTDALREYLE
ncbi:hypothetical protein SAMN05444422_11610 [Halobiforma haloterrestris]|uniref:DUF7119 domain-containing protein n=1 Tax=Natronobacterium haloterrestre TaxID=148448 RepID=A0A1I1LJQ9_NATHA|nr:hypothetical protein [Halobiforma haloterrestris]SFC71208.1 hypothetical protein SAMN05444422_11610 [Halobiforma haloterrestris]